MSFHSEIAPALVIVSLSLLFEKLMVFELSCLCVFLISSNKPWSLIDLRLLGLRSYVGESMQLVSGLAISSTPIRIPSSGPMVTIGN